jgi:hypothetical protein
MGMWLAGGYEKMGGERMWHMESFYERIINIEIMRMC